MADDETTETEEKIMQFNIINIDRVVVPPQSAEMDREGVSPVELSSKERGAAFESELNSASKAQDQGRSENATSQVKSKEKRPDEDAQDDASLTAKQENPLSQKPKAEKPEAEGAEEEVVVESMEDWEKCGENLDEIGNALFRIPLIAIQPETTESLKVPVEVEQGLEVDNAEIVPQAQLKPAEHLAVTHAQSEVLKPQALESKAIDSSRAVEGTLKEPKKVVAEDGTEIALASSKKVLEPIRVALEQVAGVGKECSRQSWLQSLLPNSIRPLLLTKLQKRRNPNLSRKFS